MKAVEALFPWGARMDVLLWAEKAIAALSPRLVPWFFVAVAISLSFPRIRRALKWALGVTALEGRMTAVEARIPPLVVEQQNLSREQTRLADAYESTSRELARLFDLVAQALAHGATRVVASGAEIQVREWRKSGKVDVDD